MVEIISISSRFMIEVVSRRSPAFFDEEKWSKLLLENPHLFNGSLLNGLAFQGENLIAEPIEYKEFLLNPKKFKPIGICGLTIHEKGFLIGKRSDQVSTYKNHYELVPSGTLDKDGASDPIAHLIQELKEETNVEKKNISHAELKALAIEKNHYELFGLIRLSGDFSLQPSSEHSDIFFVPVEEIATFMTKNKQLLVPLTAKLIAYANS